MGRAQLDHLPSSKRSWTEAIPRGRQAADPGSYTLQRHDESCCPARRQLAITRRRLLRRTRTAAPESRRTDRLRHRHWHSRVRHLAAGMRPGPKRQSEAASPAHGPRQRHQPVSASQVWCRYLLKGPRPQAAVVVAGDQGAPGPPGRGARPNCSRAECGRRQTAHIGQLAQHLPRCWSL